ncbi:hypothetical protein [uncultured Flavobacterium sp.]|uniref:hypothetical protein n=1 Tax=uncultured Flavobacterium sp. TaxID=165435 RepID=UPI0030EC1607|tara:strand:+ start:160 stop:768 length:609 start_codon:yes stop_codon:yes gene_type:complete
MISLNNIRQIGFMLLIIVVVWFYKDYSYQVAENKRQSENAVQLRKADSLRFTTQSLSSDEIKDYLEYDNPGLNKKLEENNIKLNRIQSIVSQTLNYRDTDKNEIDVSKLLESINKKIPAKTLFVDSTKCQTNKGFVEYKNDSLKVVFTEKTFNNKSDAVAYWERREWKFLGLKTTFLGKKQFTAKVFDECGESKFMKIQKKE